MDNDIKKVKYTKKVVLAGHNLTLSSDISAEHLEQIIQYLDNKIRAINSVNKPVNSSLLGIILGIDICDELFTLKKSSKISVEEINKNHQEEIEKLKLKFLEDTNDLKKTFDEQIEKVKDNRSKDYVKLSEENEKLKLEVTKLRTNNNGVFEEYKRQFDEELNDYKIVFEEEIRDYIEQIAKLEKDIELVSSELKKENFSKEKDIVKVVEENSKLSEENLFLRRRLEEFMNLNNSEDVIDDDFYDDEYVDDDAQYDDIEEYSDTEVYENNVNSTQSRFDGRKRKRGKK